MMTRLIEPRDRLDVEYGRVLIVLHRACGNEYWITDFWIASLPHVLL